MRWSISLNCYLSWWLARVPEQLFPHKSACIRRHLFFCGFFIANLMFYVSLHFCLPITVLFLCLSTAAFYNYKFVISAEFITCWVIAYLCCRWPSSTQRVVYGRVFDVQRAASWHDQDIFPLRLWSLSTHRVSCHVIFLPKYFT